MQNELMIKETISNVNICTRINAQFLPLASRIEILREDQQKENTNEMQTTTKVMKKKVVP